MRFKCDRKALLDYGRGGIGYVQPERVKADATLHMMGFLTPRSPVREKEMVKRKIVSLSACVGVVVLLSGCSRAVLHDYQPTLNQPYTDKAKYDKDIAECREWGYLTDKEAAHSNLSIWSAPFITAGLVGLATADDDPRDNDKQRTFSSVHNMNLCMERRGYDVNEMESHLPGSDYPH
jgi:hypothetical protein